MAYFLVCSVAYSIKVDRAASRIDKLEEAVYVHIPVSEANLNERVGTLEASLGTYDNE